MGQVGTAGPPEHQLAGRVATQGSREPVCGEAVFLQRRVLLAGLAEQIAGQGVLAVLAVEGDGPVHLAGRRERPPPPSGGF